MDRGFNLQGGSNSFAFEFSGFNAFFKIPLSSLDSADSSIGATFLAYPDPNLFTAALNKSTEQIASSVMAVQTTGKVIGTVEAVFNFGLNFDPAVFSGKTPNPSCVFYVEPVDGGGVGSWSSRGCSTAAINATHVRCTCNHLTAFAVLISDKQESSRHAKALGTITNVGIGLSLLGIVLTILTLMTVRALRKQLRYRVRNSTVMRICVGVRHSPVLPLVRPFHLLQILLNLVIALGLSLLMFTFITTPKSEGGCVVVSFLGLYFFSASVRECGQLALHVPLCPCATLLTRDVPQQPLVDLECH